MVSSIAHVNAGGTESDATTSDREPHVLFIRLAYDDATKGPERAANIEAHKAHLRGGAANVVQSGPLHGADGGKIGALIVFEARSMDDVKAFDAADPFVRAGVYRETQIMAWERTIP